MRVTFAENHPEPLHRLPCREDFVGRFPSLRRGVDESATFATITSLQISMLNVGTAQAQAETPRPNTNESNA